MDPLVRATLGVQQILARCAGVARALAFGAYLVWWAAAEPPPIADAVVAVGLVIATGVALSRRMRRLAPEPTTRLDLELFAHLTVVAYAVVLVSPGGVQGPLYAVVYALLMVAAAFARPGAVIGTAVYAIALEAGLGLAVDGQPSVERLGYHAALCAVFSMLNMVVFRAEIARMRRLSRLRIEAEIQKMKEAARSYRLLGAPSVAPERPTADGAADEERLLRSGVDEIHQALRFALDLLRRTLNLRTAILLGLDSSGTRLVIQELSTEEDGIHPGPFDARDGICAAALSKGAAVSLTGARSALHAPYYAIRPGIGAICATPVTEHGVVRGVLVVDRAEKEAFTPEEEETLVTATHFIVRAIENERVFVQLERAKIEQGKLYRAAERLAAATTERDVIEAGVHSAREVTMFDFAAVTVFHKSTGEHEICAASGEGGDAIVGQRFRHNSGLVSMAVANRHALPYRGQYDPSRQVVFTRGLRPPNTPSLLVLPLMVHERALGTLVLGSQRTHAFGDSVRPTLEVLASHIAVSLANARMLKRLEELATTDGLTGLYNKRTLMEVAHQKLKSAQRFNKPLSVLVCDLDHFKRVNDTYGHDVGDHVIRGFADAIRRVKRDTDVVGRFGGEEFVAVCEETDQKGALLLAERVRTELESARFPTELGEIKITCSIGVATFPSAAADWEPLFKATDEALYASKRAGRNRVTLWTPKLAGYAA